MVRSEPAGRDSLLEHGAVVHRFASLTASRDAVKVQAIIATRYGFTPTLEYCTALIEFIEALTDGQK